MGEEEAVTPRCSHAVCPKCGRRGTVGVCDSRPTKSGIRRRRRCRKCGWRATTYEVEAAALKVDANAVFEEVAKGVIAAIRAEMRRRKR